MRILIIHNLYQDPGGEDLVVQQESALLAQSDTVKTFMTKNKRGIAGFLQFLAYPFNCSLTKKLDKVISEFRPDVVHVHNIHYAIGPHFIRLLHKRQIPIVMTLHNYRLICPSATLFHDGALFTSSIHATFPWKAIREGVHQGSMLKTFWIAFTYYLHHLLGTWRKVDKFLALTSFSKEIFLQSHFRPAADKVMVKPNFILDQDSNQSLMDRGNTFLFVGRLSPEKGIKTLLDAFENSRFQLQIAGDGPMKNYVEQRCSKWPNLSYLGKLNTGQVREQMKACSALIFPSEWFEGMPMTLIEAFATGTAVIASDLGAMASMISDNGEGLLFRAGDVSDLRTCVEKWAELDEKSKNRFRTNARKNYEQHFTAETNKKLLLDIYRSLLPKT